MWLCSIMYRFWKLMTTLIKKSKLSSHKNPRWVVKIFPPQTQCLTNAVFTGEHQFLSATLSPSQIRRVLWFAESLQQEFVKFSKYGTVATVKNTLFLSILAYRINQITDVSTSYSGLLQGAPHLWWLWKFWYIYIYVLHCIMWYQYVDIRGDAVAMR